MRRLLHRAAGLVLASFTFAAPLLAQGSDAPAVTGRVLDSASTAIADAIVTVADAGGRLQSVRSGRDGAFSLRVPGRGVYTLSVVAIGHLRYSETVDVPASGRTLTIRLERVSRLAPVAVVGTAVTPSAALAEASTPTSVLGADQIAREQVSFSQEILRKMPGVYRNEFNQGIISGDIGIRGFNAESDIASTRLLIDGIPSNLNSGLGEMNAIFPLEIGRIEVVRGTSDARFGQFNLAGNVQISTRQGGNHLTSRLTTGSFGTSEAQLLSAVSRGGFSQTLFGGIRSSTGYRTNSALDKWSGSGKWSYAPADSRWRVALIVRQAALDTDAPGYLTRDTARLTPRASPTFSASDGGTIDHRHTSLHLDGPLGPASWSLKAYDQRFERTRFVRFTAAGAQQERVEDETQRGFIAQLTWRPTALADRNAVVSMGVDLQDQDNIQQRYRTVDRVRQATLRDFDFTLRNTGGFLQVAADATSRLRLTAALRGDTFDGDFSNLLTSAELPMLDFGFIAQPKVGAVYQIADALSAYANFGRSFQIGTGPAGYGTAPLSWSKNDGAEFGVTAQPSANATLRVGVWQQDASDEVRLKFDNSGDSENIGRTQRRGIDLEGTWQATPRIGLWATGTTQRAILVEPGLLNPEAKGKRLNHVPDWTAKFGVDVIPAFGWNVGLWAYAQGEYHLTDRNDRGTFGAQQTVNLDVSYRWRGVAVGLGATNLLDRYNEYVWWDGTRTLHSPAAGRALFLSVTLDR